MKNKFFLTVAFVILIGSFFTSNYGYAAVSSGFQLGSNESTVTKQPGLCDNKSIGSSCVLSDGGVGTCKQDSTWVSAGWSDKVCFLNDGSGTAMEGGAITTEPADYGTLVGNSTDAGSITVAPPASNTPDASVTNGASFGGTPSEDSFLPGSNSAETSKGGFLPGSSPVETSNGVYIPSRTEIGLSDVSIKELLTNLLNWLLSIVGVIALIGFVISGMQYILAAGDEKLAETAKKNMTHSIMGIVIVMASLVIVQAIDYALRGWSNF